MFGIFKKTSAFDKLNKEYKKLLQESHRLSTINRSESDLKFAEAEEVLQKMEQLRKN